MYITLLKLCIFFFFDSKMVRSTTQNIIGKKNAEQMLLTLLVWLV